MSVKFNLTKGYPKVLPKIDVESSEGLGAYEQKELVLKIQEVAKQSIGEVMTHEIISAVQEFLEARNQKPVTYYEAMLIREQRENEALQKLRSDTTHDKDKHTKQSQSMEPAAMPPKVAEPEKEGFSLANEYINQQKLGINQQNKKNKANKGGKDVESFKQPDLTKEVLPEIQPQKSQDPAALQLIVADYTKTVPNKPEPPPSGAATTPMFSVFLS